MKRFFPAGFRGDSERPSWYLHDFPPVGKYESCTHERALNPSRVDVMSKRSFWLHEHQNLSVISVWPHFGTEGNWPHLNHETGGWSELTVMAAPHKHTKGERCLQREHIFRSLLKYCHAFLVAVMTKHDACSCIRKTECEMHHGGEQKKKLNSHSESLTSEALNPLFNYAEVSLICSRKEKKKCIDQLSPQHDYCGTVQCICNFNSVIFLIPSQLLSLLINRRQTRLSWIFHVIIATQILISACTDELLRMISGSCIES